LDITFSLPHVFERGTQSLENDEALAALLDCLITLNVSYLRKNKVAPLYASGVVYERTIVWDTIPALYGRGFGDCKSLAAARVAELRVSGQRARPVFRFVDSPKGDRFYHILVMTLRGWEDPSKQCGMSAHEVAYFYQNLQR
jgi:hypothetical protein